MSFHGASLGRTSMYWEHESHDEWKRKRKVCFNYEVWPVEARLPDLGAVQLEVQTNVLDDVTGGRGG